MRIFDATMLKNKQSEELSPWNQVWVEEGLTQQRSATLGTQCLQRDQYPAAAQWEG